MPRPHPFLNVDGAGLCAVHGAGCTLLLCVLVGGGLLRRTGLKIALEMFKECHLLLELLGILIELVLGEHVLLLALADRLPLVVEEAAALLFCHDLSRIVEEDTGGVIREQVAQPVFRAIVNPLGDPDRVRRSLSQRLLLLDLGWRQLLLVAAHVLRGHV